MLSPEQEQELKLYKAALPDWEGTSLRKAMENCTDRGFCSYFRVKHGINITISSFQFRFPTLYKYRTIERTPYDYYYWFFERSGISITKQKAERRNALKSAIAELEKLQNLSKN